MTAIFAVQHPEIPELLVIGADGRVSAGSSILSDNTKKIFTFVNPSCSLAVAGSSRILTLLQCHAETFEFCDPYSLSTALRVMVKADGWKAGQEDREPELFQIPGVLAWHEGVLRGCYDLCIGGGVSRLSPGFPAFRGSGGEAAAAGFLTMVETGGWPDSETGMISLTETALRIASKLDSGCGGELQVLCV